MKKFCDQPIVTMDIMGENCRYSILVNGIPVYINYPDDDAWGEPHFIEIPINNAITDGANSIDLSINPPINIYDQVYPECEGKPVKVSLTVNVRDNNSDEKFELGGIVYSAPIRQVYDTPDKEYITGSTTDKFYKIEENKVVKAEEKDAQFYFGKPVMKADDKSFYGWNKYDLDSRLIAKCKGASVSNGFNIKMPFKNPLLLLGEKIPFTEETRKELVDFEVYLSKMIKKKNFDLLEPIFEPARKNTAIYTYSPESETDILASIRETRNDRHFKIVIPNKRDCEGSYLSVFGNGKLAKITNAESECCFGFYMKGGGGSHYDLTYAKINGEWKVV